MTDPDVIFVYGTLRQDVGHPMGSLLREHARSLGPATALGTLFDAGPYPAARPPDDEASVIHGEAYEILDGHADELLVALDEYEGCPRPGEGPALFVRETCDVLLERGGLRAAWIWYYARSTVGLPRVAEGDWLDYQPGGGCGCA